LLGAFVFVAYYEDAYDHLAHRLDADLSAARKFRWERPVLRGNIGAGNAADEIYAALADWQPLGKKLQETLAEKAYFSLQLTAGESSALAQRTNTLRALRAAVQQSWSRSDLAIERGAQMHVPNYPSLVEAALLLLLEAQQGSPEDCLQECADVIRVGQDIVTSAPLEAASAATHLSALAGRVMARCAQNADLASLRRAGHELRILATRPAPTGSCIELEELAAATELRKRAALANKSTPWQVAKTLLARPQLLAAWAVYDNPARFRQITPDRYPDAMEDWKREQDYRLRSGNQEMAVAAGQVLTRLQDDMRGQAIVRMLDIGLTILAERAYRGTLPSQPSSLRDPALADPFRGQPFHYRISFNGAEFTLWSVGADFHDDGGSDDWNEAAPRDVTLHFALPHPTK
jgi:hypothetical protein